MLVDYISSFGQQRQNSTHYKFISHSPRSSLRSGHEQVQCLLTDHTVAYRWPFLYALMSWKGLADLLKPLLYANPVSSLENLYLPKPSLSRVGSEHTNLKCGTNVQTKALIAKEKQNNRISRQKRSIWQNSILSYCKKKIIEIESFSMYVHKTLQLIPEYWEVKLFPKSETRQHNLIQFLLSIIVEVLAWKGQRVNVIINWKNKKMVFS